MADFLLDIRLLLALPLELLVLQLQLLFSVSAEHCHRLAYLAAFTIRIACEVGVDILLRLGNYVRPGAHSLTLLLGVLLSVGGCDVLFASGSVYWLVSSRRHTHLRIPEWRDSVIIGFSHPTGLSVGVHN